MRISTRASLTRFIAALGAVLAATSVHAQAQLQGRNLNIFAVNLDNKNVYSVNFPSPPTGSGTTTIDNTDQNNYVRPEALAFVVNAQTDQLDLLIADNQRGTIYRYPGALASIAPPNPPNPTVATLVWNSQTSGTGPTAPDAMAVDGFGNLFVTNATSGHSQNGQLWEFPVGTQNGEAVSGTFGTPVLLDSKFGSKEALLEVVIVPTDVAGASGVSGGDLVLLTTSAVYVYSQSTGYTKRTTLLSFPNGNPVPGGIDFWPFGDGVNANYSVLISSNGSGVINRYFFTNPLTAAPAPFATGLGSPFKIKTLFQQGNPLLFVSETGAILEFGADTNGNGIQLATITQNVTSPQGLAVSNAFTSAAEICVQQGSCNLTGLAKHTPKGIAKLNGNFVENVCTVNHDPRVSTTGGVWACSAESLPVNSVCPGFDDTGKMVIPDTLCGRSGSSKAGFSLIKTLIDDTQFFVASGNQNAGGYVQHELVNADGSNPLCGTGLTGDGLPGSAVDGAVIWGSLLAEGTDRDSPNMRDFSSGCGSGRGGKGGFSIFGEGFFVNEGAPELNPTGGLQRPLENFAQTKYQDLTGILDNLTLADPNNPKHTRWTDTNPNVLEGVSLGLWGGNVPPANNLDPFGCIDQSWLDFYNATNVDTDGSAQWIADLQNAANLLTNADATGNTTCAGIIDFAQANTPSAFVQTSQSPNALNVLNPYGQLVSLVSNLYYTVNTRLLGNPQSGTWPLPVSINVLPTAVTLTPGGQAGSAMLSWNAPETGASCALSSSDNQYSGLQLVNSPQQLTIPASDAGSIVTYTVSCSGVPAASTVYAYVTVYETPTISVSSTPVVVNTPVTLSWNTYNNQGCTASSTGTDTNPADAFTGKKSGSGSMVITPNAAGTDTYTLTCTTPANTVVSINPVLSVLAAPTLSFSSAGVQTTMTALENTPTTLYWSLNGNTNCTLSGTDGTNTSLVPNQNGTGTTQVNPGSANTFTYTLACTGPPATPSQQVMLTTVQQPTVTFNSATGPTSTTAVQGIATQLYWTGNSGCTWSSTDKSFNAASATSASGNLAVNPNAAGTFTYTLTCASPTTPAVATLTVNAPQPPTIYVNPTSITLGGSATVFWTINTGDVCTASSSGTDTNKADAFTGMKGVSGSMTVNPNATGTDTYTLACTAPANTSVSTSPPLTVNPSLAKIAISVALSGDGDLDDPGTLSWSLSGGATGCVVSGAWPLHAVPQFSPFGVSASGSKKLGFSATGTYTYTLTCTNPSTPVQTSVTIRSSDRD